MRVRNHGNYGHGLRSGTDHDMNCPNCTRERAEGVTPDITGSEPTIGNMPGADLNVTFPSGQTRTVNMLRLLVQTRNAEARARYGMFLPGVGKLHPTIAALREAYELDWFYDAPVRTWTDAALVMRHFYGLCREHIGS